MKSNEPEYRLNVISCVDSAEYCIEQAMDAMAERGNTEAADSAALISIAQSLIAMNKMAMAALGVRDINDDFKKNKEAENERHPVIVCPHCGRRVK